MANKKPLPTRKQKLTPVPPEAEVREYFQKIFYVNPSVDEEGNPMSARLDLAGPTYPTWAQTRDMNREPGPVRFASQEEIAKYNDIMAHEGMDAAREWLDGEWND